MRLMKWIYFPDSESYHFIYASSGGYRTKYKSTPILSVTFIVYEFTYKTVLAAIGSWQYSWLKNVQIIMRLYYDYIFMNRILKYAWSLFRLNSK